MRIVGIDPGVSGALAFIVDGAYSAHTFMPTVKLGKSSRVNASSLAGFIEGVDPDLVAIERVNAMPGQGVSSMFSFGHAAGVLEGVVATLGLPCELVTPQAWKRHFGLIGSEKDAARAKAVQLFPGAPLSRKKDGAIADALLIAEYVAQRRAAA